MTSFADFQNQALLGGGLDGDKVAAHEQAAHEKRNWVRLSYDCNNHCTFCLDSNAHDGTISAFAVGDRGTLTLLDPTGTTATPGVGNLDLAFDQDGKFLYQLRNAGSITAYRVEHDGHLTQVGVTDSLPGSVTGLAAR